jgi:hypothetical protein
MAYAKVHPNTRRLLTALVLAAAGLLFAACGAAPEAKGIDLAECAQKSQCGAGPVFVADYIDFAVKASDGTVAGFDLDGIDSAEGGFDGCYAKDHVSPDGDTGVDNQLGAVLASLPPQILEIVPAILQASINNGGLLLLMEWVDLSLPDKQGDDKEGVVFRQGGGTPLLGTDGNLLPHQTFVLDDDYLLGLGGNLRTIDGGREAGPLTMRFRMQFLGTPVGLTFHKVRLRLKTADDGSLHGVIGGSVTIEDVLEMLSLLGGDDTELREVLKAAFPPLADIRDLESGECTEISAALNVRFIPAFIQAETNAPASISTATN